MKAKSRSKDSGIKDPLNMMRIFKGISLLDAMLYKNHAGSLKKSHGSNPKKAVNNKKKYSKISKKTSDTSAPPEGKKQRIPDSLPANRHDICNYLARNSMANAEIQAVIKIDGKLDFDKLKRAVRLSVDAEPVLGCRYVEEDPPCWKRLDNLDEITFCSMEETDDADEAVTRFLQSPLDMDNDPKVKVKIIRSLESDILGIKINNACCDGTGTKEYIKLLSRIYSNIDKGDDTIPEIRIVSSEDLERISGELDETFQQLRENTSVGDPRTMWAFPWIHRGGDSVRFALCRLPEGSLESIYQYGKSKEATVNDLILTAFYRTMFKISKPKYGVPMDIYSTIDLRRYLSGQKHDALRNLSGGFKTRIARITNESFESTLSRVVAETKKIKKGHRGVNNDISEEYSENITYRYFNDYFEHMSKISGNTAKSSEDLGNVCFPGLSNLGYISKTPIRFGENVVTDAYVVPPVICTPGFVLLTGSYNGILTMSVGFSRASISQRAMKGLLNMVQNELIKGCGYESPHDKPDFNK